MSNPTKAFSVIMNSTRAACKINTYWIAVLHFQQECVTNGHLFYSINISKMVALK